MSIHLKLMCFQRMHKMHNALAKLCKLSLFLRPSKRSLVDFLPEDDASRDSGIGSQPITFAKRYRSQDSQSSQVLDLLFSGCHCHPLFAGLYICRVAELLDVDGGIVPGPHARRGGSVLAARVTRVESSGGGGGGGGIQRQPVGHSPGRGGGGGDGRFRELGSWHQPSSVIVFPQRTHPCLVRCSHSCLCTSQSASYAAPGRVHEGEISRTKLSDSYFL